MMKNTHTPTDKALAKHLNAHAVPIPETMVDACKLAIEFINRGEKNALVDLPSNARFRNIVTKQIEYAIPAFKIAMICHLDKFLNDQKAWVEFVES